MHCEACVAIIEETVSEQSGVTSVSVELESARAVVTYDPSRLREDKIRAAISEAGYVTMPVN